jgi:hypothetical protein
VSIAELKSAGLYSREDLCGRCIRFLDLSTTDAGKDESLQDDLRFVSLDSNPFYEALSYAWGSDADAPSRQIICSDMRISITKNCYDALSTLRRSFKVRAIWVDAICINQYDDEEKGHQIPLMHDIYGKTKRVFIWLGNGTGESDEAFDWVLHASKYVSVLLGTRFKDFPANITPKEVLKAIRLIPLFFGKLFPLRTLLALHTNFGLTMNRQVSSEN